MSVKLPIYQIVHEMSSISQAMADRLPRYQYLLNRVLEWNQYKADIFATNIFIRFRQVSTLDRLGLWDIDQ